MDKSKNTKYKLDVSMSYFATIEIEAESFDDAVQQARDQAGDGMLIKNADLVDVNVEESTDN